MRVPALVGADVASSGMYLGIRWYMSGNPVKEAALGSIRLYQMTISRVLPPSCRFLPTCSEYTREAISRYGVPRGVWFGLKRIGRCHPFSPGGYDPVP